MTALVALVCTAQKRASTQHSRSHNLKTGESAWGRDVHHVSLDRLETLCGIDCGEWLLIEKTTPEEALLDPTHGLCVRCNKKLNEMT